MKNEYSDFIKNIEKQKKCFVQRVGDRYLIGCGYYLVSMLDFTYKSKIIPLNGFFEELEDGEKLDINFERMEHEKNPIAPDMNKIFEETKKTMWSMEKTNVIVEVPKFKKKSGSVRIFVEHMNYDNDSVNNKTFVCKDEENNSERIVCAINEEYLKMFKDIGYSKISCGNTNNVPAVVFQGGDWETEFMIMPVRMNDYEQMFKMIAENI